MFHGGLDSHLLLTDDPEHVYLCLLAICISYLKEHLFRCFAQFSTRLFGETHSG